MPVSSYTSMAALSPLTGTCPTGFACTWYYRRNLTSSARNLWMQGILPVLGGLILWFLGGWSLWLDYDVATQNDYTMWTVPGIHWQIGGVFVIEFVSSLLGLILYLYLRFAQPAFFIVVFNHDDAPMRLSGCA